jgi:hypothetical protein
MTCARRLRVRLLVALCAVASGAGCSRDQAVLTWREPPEGFGMLRLEPSVATLVVGTNDRPVTQRFGAYKLLDGRSTRVTQKLRWSTDQPNLVQIDGDGLATVQALRGGDVVIAATNGRDVATARLTVKVGLTSPEDGLAKDVSSLFDSTAVDPARAPEILYPAEGTLLPPNLPAFELHFRPHGGTTVYEIAIGNDRTDVRLLTRCQVLGAGCVHQMRGEPWRILSDSNRGAGLRLSVRATDEAGGRTGVSAARSLWLGSDDLRGSLHYWTASPVSAAMRVVVGNPGPAVPERLFGSEVSGECVGCHTVSRDGSRTVASSGTAGGSGRTFLYDLMNGSFRFTNRRLQFSSFSPDGLFFVGVPGEGPSQGPKDFLLQDGRDATDKGTVPLRGMRGTHPDYSPDGRRIVFCAVDTNMATTDNRPVQGAIAYVERDGADWASPRTIMGAALGSNFHSPAFAPSSAQVAFVESLCETGHQDPTCDGEGDPATRLWVAPVPMSAATGPMPRLLDNINRAGGTDEGEGRVAMSAPRWHPQPFRGPDGRSFTWLTFSSSRRFGLRGPPASDRKGAVGALLWMAAVTVAPDGNRDPSYAPFVLPYQDLATSNHGPQWTIERR